VKNHAHEEDGQEPGDRAFEATDQTPTQKLAEVGGIVDLAGETVPTAGQECTGFALDESGVLDRLPRELREGLALDHGASLLLAETVLLAIAGVEDVVCCEEHDEEGDVGLRRPLVDVGGGAHQVEDAMAVRQGDTGHVPEDQHEAPLLVAHVPGGDDELLALTAGIGVEPVRQQEEADLGSDVTIQLVLLNRGGDRDQEQEEPRQTDFEEHLEVDEAEDSRVQFGTHEEVVYEVSSHPVLRATSDSTVVGDEADGDSGENSDAHVGTEIVDQVRNGKQARNVEDAGCDHGDPESEDGIAEVIQTDIVTVGDRIALGPDTGKGDVKHDLIDEEKPVRGKGSEGRTRALQITVMSGRGPSETSVHANMLTSIALSVKSSKKSPIDCPSAGKGNCAL